MVLPEYKVPSYPKIRRFMRENHEYIPCNPDIPCKLREFGKCYEDIHHEAHPKDEYRTRLEKKFRMNILNKVLMCRAMHDDWHAQGLKPQKPDVATMIEFLRGEL